MQPNHYSIRTRLRHFRIAKLAENFLRFLSRNDAAQFFQPGSLNIGYAPKFLQQFLRCPWAHTGDFVEHRFCLPLSSPLPVKRYRKTVGLVANLLNQVKNRRMPLQHDWLIFLPQHVKNLLFLRDALNWLIDDMQRVERLRRGVQLADTTIDQD